MTNHHLACNRTLVRKSDQIFQELTFWATLEASEKGGAHRVLRLRTKTLTIIWHVHGNSFISTTTHPPVLTFTYPKAPCNHHYQNLHSIQYNIISLLSVRCKATITSEATLIARENSRLATMNHLLFNTYGSDELHNIESHHQNSCWIHWTIQAIMLHSNRILCCYILTRRGTLHCKSQFKMVQTISTILTSCLHYDLHPLSEQPNSRKIRLARNSVSTYRHRKP